MDLENNREGHNDIAHFLEKFRDPSLNTLADESTYSPRENVIPVKPQEYEHSFAKLEKKIEELEKRFEKSAAQSEQILSELAQTREELSHQRDKDAFLEHISRTISALRTSVDNLSRAQQENALREASPRRDFDGKVTGFPQASSGDNLIYRYDGNNVSQALETKSRVEREEEQRIFASLRQKASQLKAVNSALDREIKKVQQEKLDALKKSTEQAKEILSLRDQLTAAEEKFKSFDFEGRIISIKQEYQQKVSRLEMELCEISDTCMKQVEEIESLKAENIELREVAKQNSELQALVLEKEGEMRALQYTMQALQAQRSGEAQTQLAQAQDAFNAIKAERDELAAKLAQSKDEFNKLSEEKALLERNVQDLMAKLSENDAVIRDLKSQIEVLSQQNRTLGEENENLLRENETLSAQQILLEQEKDRLVQDKQDLTQEKEKLSAQNVTLTQSNEALTQQNKDLNAEWDSLTKANEDLTAQKENLSKQKEELALQNRALSQEKETLQQAAQALTQEKQALSAQNETLVHEKQDLSAQKEALAQEKQDLLAQTETLAKEKQALSSQNETLVHEKQALSAQNETLLREKEQFTQTRADLDKSAQTLVREKQELARANEELQSQQAALEEDNRRLSKQNEDLTSARDNALKEKAEFVSKAETLTRQTEDLRAQSEQLSVHNKELVSQVDNLENANKELKAENKNLREKSAAALAAGLVEQKREEVLAKQAPEKAPAQEPAQKVQEVSVVQTESQPAVISLPEKEESTEQKFATMFDEEDAFLKQTDSLLGRIKWSLFGHER